MSDEIKQEDKNVSSLFVKQVMTEDMKKIKAHLEKDERVQTKIEATSKRKFCDVKIDGKLYASYGEPEMVIMNGYRYYVPRGVSVLIPRLVATTLEENDRCIQEGEQLIREKYPFIEN